MAFLAGLLLLHLPSESRAFAALSMLMLRAELRGLYLPGLELLRVRCGAGR